MINMENVPFPVISVARGPLSQSLSLKDAVIKTELS
jgi:hypothetical protein